MEGLFGFFRIDIVLQWSNLISNILLSSYIHIFIYKLSSDFMLIYAQSLFTLSNFVCCFENFIIFYNFLYVYKPVTHIEYLIFLKASFGRSMFLLGSFPLLFSRNISLNNTIWLTFKKCSNFLSLSYFSFCHSIYMRHIFSHFLIVTIPKIPPNL